MNPNDMLPPDLEMMSSMALKLYKVRVLLQKEDHWTVYAHDADEVKQLILAGKGKPAGGTDPQVLKMDIQEAGDGDDTNLAIMENAITEGNPKTKRLVEVVAS